MNYSVLVPVRKKTLSRRYTDEEWEDAYNLAEKQTVAGVLLDALEIIQDESPELMPSKMILLQWIGSCQMTEQTSKQVGKAVETTVKYFRENGLACQILKGCAVGRYYPQPLRRSSGDIDIWLDGGRKKIYEFARAFDKDGMLYGVNYHHIHFHLLKDVHIEVHIWPSFLSSPLRNWRLHKFCKQHMPTMEMAMPSLAFDRVFILLHCYGISVEMVLDFGRL